MTSERDSILLILGAPVVGGVTRLTVLLANELVEDYEVTILTTGGDISYEVDERIEVRVGGGLLYSFGLGHAMKNLVLFPLTALRYDHDVIVNLSGSYPSTVLLDRLGANAVHYSHHAFDTSEVFDRTGLLERLYCRAIEGIQHWARGKQVPVLCNSARTRRGVKNRYDIEVFRSYPPVNVDTFTPVKTCDGYTLLSGRYHPDKKIEKALEYIAGRDVVVAGAVVDEAYYEGLVETYPEVDFRCDLPEEDWIRVHQRAGAYVFTNPEEHFGIAPAEAMSCGVPAVIPEGAGIAEIITDGENGYLVKPDFSNLNAKVKEAHTGDASVRRRARETIVNVCAPSALAHDVGLAVEISKFPSKRINTTQLKNLSQKTGFEREGLEKAVVAFGYRRI